MEDPTSETQNMNLLLNAFDLDETTTQVEKLDNEVNADGDNSKHDDADNEWEEMCEYLTQRKVSVVVDDDDDESPISATNQVRTQRAGKKLSFFIGFNQSIGDNNFLLTM